MLRAVSPPTSGITKYWGLYKLSVNQTAGLSSGSPIRFDTAMTGNIALSGYQFTLPASGVYNLDASVLAQFTANTGSLRCSWYDVTNSASHAGTCCAFSTNYPNSASSLATVMSMIEVAGPTVVELRIASSTTSVLHVAQNFTTARIVQIA